MTKGLFQKKQLDIPKDWNIFKNEFMNLEPDNKYPVDEVFYYFDEDLLIAYYQDYFIDLGFYGSYNNNREGFFRIYVAKGNFSTGELYELFISRSTDEIKQKLDFYFNAIPKRELEKVKGYLYNEESNTFDNFDLYSAIHSVSVKLKEKELNGLAKRYTR